MFSGTALVQVVGIVTAPLTARIYDPDQAGIAGVINGLAGVCAGVACLRYEQAIALPAQRRDGLAIVGLCLLIAPIVCGAGALVLMLFGADVGRLLNLDSGRRLLLVMPISILAAAVFAVAMQLSLRERAYHAIARARLAQSTTQIGLQLGIGALVDGRAWVMVWGYVAGYVLGIRSLVAGQAGLARAIRDAWDRRTLRRLATEYRRFPLFGSWAAFFDSLTGSLPLFAVVAAFGSEEAGYVRMAQTLVLLPVAALSSAVASVYWAESARSIREEPSRLLPLYRTVTRRLAAAAAALVLGSLLLPWLVPIVLSAKWSTSGEYAVILAFPAAASLISSGAVNLSLLRQNHVESAWIVGRFLLLFAVATAARRAELDVRAFLVVLASAQVAGYLALLLFNDIAVRRFSRTAQA